MPECTPITEVLTRTEQTYKTYQPSIASQSEYIGGISVMPNRNVCADNTGAETGFQTSINNNVALQDKGLLSHSDVVRGPTESSQAITPLVPRYHVADAGHRSRSAGLVSRPTEVVYSDPDTAETMQPAQPPERSHDECVCYAHCVDMATSAISVLPTKSGLGVSGVGNQNTIRPQKEFSVQGSKDSSQIRTQLFPKHKVAPIRTTQDSSMFRPVLPESSAFRRVSQPLRLPVVESPPHPSSHELRRPFSPDLSDVSDSELELNRLPLMPPAAATAVSRQ